MSAFQNLNVTHARQFADRTLHVEFGDNAELLDKQVEITWMVSVPHGGPFATKNKASIDNNCDFANFIKIISAPGEEQHKCVVTIKEKHPKAVAQVSF